MQNVVSPPMPADRTVLAAVPMTQLLFGLSRGVAPPLLCETADLSPTQLTDRDRFVPHAWYYALWDALRAHLPGVAVGVEMGKFMRPEHFGYAGLVFRHARDGLDALQKLVRFSGLLDSYAAQFPTRVRVERDHVSVTTSPRLVDGMLECTEAAAVGLVTQLESLTGVRPEVREVRMHLDGRQRLTQYEAVFGCPVRFGCAEDVLVLGRDALQVPLKDANAEAADRIEAYVAETLTPDADQGFAAKLSWIVREQLQDGEVSQQAAASALGLGVRTLQRRLSKHNQTFAQLVEDVRRESATRMLRETHAAVYEIAFCLGYQDVSSFCRAFKRWEGISPGDFRSGKGTH